MCGILGQINFVNKNISRPSLELIRHRGPDGTGNWYSISGKIYLGHTRLAIQDTTGAGEQPMSDSSGRFTLSYNGEIYNHMELRSLMPGVRWRGSSDSETLLELFALKGVDALPLLKGMFAFAVHDSFDDSVTLVRDRLGIKPLWIKKSTEELTFASEVRVLSAGKNAFTRKALSEYLGFGRFPGEGEVMQGVFSMAPGTWQKVTAKGSVSSNTWWAQNFDDHSALRTRDCYVEKVKRLVTRAIKEHLISDVEVGAFLSGGIDSSILACVAGKELGSDLKTFTVGFPQTKFDERAIARRVADQIGSNHFEIEICEEKCQAWVMEAVQKLDLPSVDAINTYIVSKAVREEGIKVGLSGLGGDELFGGYPAFQNIPMLNWIRFLPNGSRDLLLRKMPGVISEKFAGLTGCTTTDLTLARRRFMSVGDLRKIGLSSGIPKLPKVPDSFDEMGKISWAEMYGYMIPMLLRDSDQMSMAVGLEIRVPFLDHHLVEKVLRFPQKMKKGSGVKPLLVDAFKDELPSEVYNRPKQGFALPMAEWMKGPLSTFTLEGVYEAANILNLSTPLVQMEKFNNNEIHWTRLWHWSVLGHWMKNSSAGKVSKKELYKQQEIKIGTS